MASVVRQEARPHSRAPFAWILVASLLFATMSTLVKTASSSVSLPEIVFFRTLPAAIGLFALARFRGDRIGSEHWRLHALRGVVGVTGTFVSFYAVSHLPLATATTLEYTTPLFLLAFVLVAARHQFTRQMALAIVGGFAGVIVLLRPSLQAGEALAFCAALGSGAVAAIAYALIRRLGEVGEPAWRIVLWYSVAGASVSAALIPFGAISRYTTATIVVLACVGVVGAFAQLALTRAFSTGPTTSLASLQYSTVAFAAIYGVALWDDTFSAASAAGLSVIVASCILALRRVRKPVQLDG